VGGELLRVSDKAAASLNHPGHCCAIEGTQVLAARDSGDQAGIELIVFVRPGHLIVEIGLHLKQLAEVWVVLVEQVVQEALTDQDDLHVQRNRLGFQGYRADQAQGLTERLDAHLLGPENPFQAVPGVGLREKLAGVHEEVSPIGSVERTGLDQVEVGDESTHLSDMLYASNQVVVSGVFLVDDWRTLGLTVVDQDVDLIAAEPSLLHLLRRQAEE
jgi:hypothetical protein